MRVVLPVMVSKATAWTMRWGPATSATMRRRVASSLVQARPPIMPFRNRCHGASQPAAASAAMASAPAACAAWPAISNRLRSRLSASAPASAPINSIGRARDISTSETASAEPVSS